jgi:hypothetical protein
MMKEAALRQASCGADILDAGGVVAGAAIRVIDLGSPSGT